MSNKRGLLNEYFFNDWVYLGAIGVASFSAYTDLSGTWFTEGNSNFTSSDLIYAGFNAVLHVSFVFGILVLICGLIRREISGIQILERVSSEPNRLVKVFLTLLVIAGSTLFVAYSNATSLNSAGSSSVGVSDLSSYVPVSRTCRPQGRDELCISGFESATFGGFDFELTYFVPKLIDGFEISKSSWEVDVDCETQSVTSGSLKFFNADLELFFDAATTFAAEEGLQETYINSELLSECG